MASQLPQMAYILAVTGDPSPDVVFTPLRPEGEFHGLFA